MVVYLVVVLGWIGIGAVLGQWSLKECVSLEWDEPTKSAMVLFPLSALLFGEGIACPAFWFWSSHRWSAASAYRVLVVVFWPLKVACSLIGLLLALAIGLLGMLVLCPD